MKSIRGLSISLLVLGGLVACESQNSCVEVGSDGTFGTDHLEKIELVSEFVSQLGFDVQKEDVAAILGTAYAASQLQGGQSGTPVRICFRQEVPGETEYRVLSLKGTPLVDWRSSVAFPKP